MERREEMGHDVETSETSRTFQRFGLKMVGRNQRRMGPRIGTSSATRVQMEALKVFNPKFRSFETFENLTDKD